MDVFNEEYQVALGENFFSSNSQSLLVQIFEESNEGIVQGNNHSDLSPQIPEENKTQSREEEDEVIRNKAILLTTELKQNRHNNQKMIQNLYYEETTSNTPKKKNKSSSGRRKKTSTKKGGHDWRDPGNQRTKCITTFMENVFLLFDEYCQKYEFKLQRPDFGKLFGKNKKIQKKFISLKLYQILCQKPNNKKIIKIVVKKNKTFSHMVNYTFAELYENKYLIEYNSNNISLKENNFLNAFGNLCLSKALETKKKKLKKENHYPEEEIEEMISSLEKYSKNLIKDLNEEKDYKERINGKEPTLEYEVIPEIENSLNK